MLIEIDRKLIRAGIKRHPLSCPVALAIAERIDRECRVGNLSVDVCQGRCDKYGSYRYARVEFPEAVTWWIRRFDRCPRWLRWLFVRPISFELPLEDILEVKSG